MYASSWFLTLFTTALNLNLLCCRIMDVFLSEGMEMIFKIALALLTIGKETVLSLDMEAMLKVYFVIALIELSAIDSDDRDSLFQYFQKELPGKVESDVEGLFTLAYSIKINQKKMKKMEKDYAELRKKEQEEMVELRVRKCRLSSKVLSNFSTSAAITQRKSFAEETKRAAGGGEHRAGKSTRSRPGVES